MNTSQGTIEIDDSDGVQKHAAHVASPVFSPHSSPAVGMDSPGQVPGSRRLVGILCAILLAFAVAWGLYVRAANEAKVANALDKLEVQLQHKHADFSTWEEIEYDMCYMMNKHVLFDEALFELKRQIENEAEQKMKEAGVDVDKVKRRVLH